MIVNAYGEHVGGGPEPWQLSVVRRLADEGRVLRYCDVCGRPMAARGQGGARKYCSFACRQEANRYMARRRRRCGS